MRPSIRSAERRRKTLLRIFPASLEFSLRGGISHHPAFARHVGFDPGVGVRLAHNKMPAGAVPFLDIVVDGGVDGAFDPDS